MCTQWTHVLRWYNDVLFLNMVMNNIGSKKVSKEILKLVLIYVTIPRSLIFLFFGNTKTIYFIFCIIYQNIILRIQVDMILTSLVFLYMTKKKTKNYASYRILLSICTSANSGKIHVYLLKDAVGWKNLLSERNTSNSFGFPIHSLSTKKLPTFTMQRLIISSYEFYIQEKF